MPSEITLPPEREENRKACPRESLDDNRSGDSLDDAGSARLLAATAAVDLTESRPRSIPVVIVAAAPV
jgi:hypothetical protein